MLRSTLGTHHLLHVPSAAEAAHRTHRQRYHLFRAPLWGTSCAWVREAGKARHSQPWGVCSALLGCRRSTVRGTYQLHVQACTAA